MRDTHAAPLFHADDFFALRTPILPFSGYLQWARALQAPTVWEDAALLAPALRVDKARLRTDLRRLICRPEIREALFIASPTLDQSLEYWLRDPESDRGGRAELVLVRYFQRMSHRATPFGLFAGHSVGHFGESTTLTLDHLSTARRMTRLDCDYLARLANEFQKSTMLRHTLTLRPNTSLYRAAGRLRYTEYAIDEHGYRRYKLVAVADTPHLLSTLERAHAGAPMAALAEPLAREAEVSLSEAEAFVHELLDSQILVSDLEPLITGGDPSDDLAARLESCGETAVAGRILRTCAAHLHALDRAGLGHAPERYRSLARELEALPVAPDLSRLLQVDLFKPAPRLILGAGVADEIVRCTTVLRRIVEVPERDALAAFRAAFVARYEERRVPLMEALDPETGIGFPVVAESNAADAPLLKDFVAGSSVNGAEDGWSARDVRLFKRLQQVLAAGLDEWALDDADVKALGTDATTRSTAVPDSAAAMVTLAAASAEAVDRGDYKLLFRGCYGPPGSRMLGRFCHGDAHLHERTQTHMRAEEAYRSEVIFAELVHLPQGRSGNVLMRPVLREHEIAFLGRAGVDVQRQITVADLELSVSGERVILYSVKHGREVMPSFSSALDLAATLGVSQFLGALQDQQVQNWLGWSWGPLARERFLPRVSYGRTVLARAQWAVEGDDIKPLLAATGVERFRRVQQWRRERVLPRFTLLVDHDSELLLDLDNVLSIETFCDLVKRRSSFVLAENFPGADELAVHGPEGRFTHEVVLPLLRVRHGHEPVRTSALTGVGSEAAMAGTFAPGSEWLYFKLYGGQGTADLVLLEGVAPGVATLKARGAIDGWFFIRYGDPDPHLRVRLRGDPRRLCGEALPEFYRHLNPMLQNGRLWRIELGTYQRETDRYGGPLDIENAERLFEFDSDAALEIVRQCPGDEGATHRWQLALAGVDRYLRDFGFDLARRSEFARSARDAYAREMHTGGKATQGWLTDRFRKERKAIEQLVDERAEPDAPALRAGLEALALRSRLGAALIAEMAGREAQGSLSRPLDNIAHGLIHMFVNRLLRSLQRTQEFVLYEFLVRLYRSALARADAVGKNTGS